jgi:hypothetical protein
MSEKRINFYRILFGTGIFFKFKDLFLAPLDYNISCLEEIVTVSNTVPYLFISVHILEKDTILLI